MFRMFIIAFIIALILAQVFKCVEAKGQDAIGTLDIKAKIIFKCPNYGYVLDNTCDGMTHTECCTAIEFNAIEPSANNTFEDLNGETWITQGNLE